jgi:hypothetical protein
MGISCAHAVTNSCSRVLNPRCSKICSALRGGVALEAVGVDDVPAIIAPPALVTLAPNDKLETGGPLRERPLTFSALSASSAAPLAPDAFRTRRRLTRADFAAVADSGVVVALLLLLRDRDARAVAAAGNPANAGAAERPTVEAVNGSRVASSSSSSAVPSATSSRFFIDADADIDESTEKGASKFILKCPAAADATGLLFPMTIGTTIAGIGGSTDLSAVTGPLNVS